MLTSLQHFKRMSLEPRRAGARQAKRAALTGDLAVRKDVFGPAVAMDGRSLRFTISTAAIDRAMDTIDQAGWILDAYRANPVVLWMHDNWSLPIGRCTDLGPEDGALQATVEFVRADMPVVGEMAEAVLLLCKEGFLNATSVGFRPIDFDVTEDPDRGADHWFPGFDFKRQELTEFSIVTVPCNPEALINPAHRLDPADPLANLLGDVSTSLPARSSVLRGLRAFDRFAPG